jgi:hypothetical protein
MAPVDPEAVDRLLARLDAAVRAGPTADAGVAVDAEPVVVELIVESDGNTHSWFVRLDAAGGCAARGPAEDPTVVVRIDGDTFVALRSGALDVQRAIDGGRLTVRGDLGALARARPALRAVAAALAAD